MNLIELLQDRLQELLEAGIDQLPAVTLALIILAITWAVALVARKTVNRILERAEPRESLQILLEKITAILIWTIGSLVAVTIAFPSVTPGTLLSALGLGSIAIGFAFKDIFENFFAGMLILIREPFRIHDWVECEGIEGRVEHISIRDTRLIKVNGEAVTLPNAMLFKNPVNIQTNQPLRRIDILCGVAYSSDLPLSQEVIAKAVRDCGSVDNDHDVQVFANAFDASSINMEIAWWTKSDPLSERQSRAEVITAVKAALDQEGIEIPFPQRALHFQNRLSLDHNSEGDAPSS